MAAILAVHLTARFDTMMYGFAPGRIRLTDAPLATKVPRTPAAVRNVPAGSVIIATNQPHHDAGLANRTVDHRTLSNPNFSRSTRPPVSV